MQDSVQKHKEQALEIVDEETWNKYFQAFKKENEGINDAVIARAVLGHLGKKSSSQKSQLELHDAKSVNGYKPPCALNIVLYVINSIDRESKKGNPYRMHIVMDRDYNVFTLLDFQKNISGVKGKHCMFKNIVLDEYMGGRSLKATKKTEVGTTTKRFESPQPLDDFSGLEKNKYYVLEGWGEPGSFNEKTSKEGEQFGVHWNLVDEAENTVRINLFNEQVDKIAKKGIDVESLDWCDVIVEGVYKEFKKQREEGNGYIIYNNLNALDVKVKRQLEKPEEIESHINKEEVKTPSTIREITAEQLKEVLPLEPDEFLEWLDEQGIDDPEGYYDKLMRKGLIIEEDDDVVLVEGEVEEEQPSNRTEKQEPPSTIRESSESSTITPEESERNIESKVVEIVKESGEGGAQYKDIAQRTGAKDEYIESAINNLLVEGKIYEPKVGRFKIMDEESSSTRREFDASQDDILMTMAKSLEVLDKKLMKEEKDNKGVAYKTWKKDVEEKLNAKVSDEEFQKRIDYMKNTSGDIFEPNEGRFKLLNISGGKV